MKAILINKDDDGYRAELSDVSEDQLPEGDVTVQVDYSTLNYKDSLAITGSSPVVRSFPMVPGIDLAGTVIESDSEEYQAGDEVLATDWGLGEIHWGGYAQLARLQAGWLTPLPRRAAPSRCRRAARRRPG